MKCSPLGSAVSAIWIAAAVAVGGCSKPSEPPPLLANSNVVVVLVDTLRADHLGRYGHSLATSPFFDELARESVLFETAIAPASQTVPSMLSLWTGLYPNRHGNQYYSGIRAFRVPTPRTKPQVPERVDLMSERLRKRGYRTGAIVTNPWLQRSFGFGRGFDVYEHLDESTKGPEVNAAARAFLASSKDERFFLYIHYMDAHTPYAKQPRYAEQFAAPASPHPGIAALLSGYNAEIRAVDDYFRGVYDAIRELNLGDDTLLVFVSDHGEEFGEHGGFGHGHALHQELVHVPLLLHHPKLLPMARRISTPVSLVDVTPTVLELVLGESSGDVDGVSLAPLIRGEGTTPDRVIFSELGTMTAALRDGKKVVRSNSEKNRNEWAFDLTSDPDEAGKIEPEAPWARRLSDSIDEHLRKRAADTGDHGTLDPAIEERVRALGY